MRLQSLEMAQFFIIISLKINMFFLGIVLFIILVVVFTRYEPKLDLVLSYNKYILFLWYNKIEGEYVSREYIKLFTI